MQEGRKIIQTNRKAFHDFTIFEKYTAGIVLTGTEIKSIRAGGLNLKDSFARIEKGEVILYNCHISPYEHGNIYNHEAERPRKLLLTKREILKIIGKIKQMDTIIGEHQYQEAKIRKLHMGVELIMVICLMIF